MIKPFMSIADNNNNDDRWSEAPSVSDQPVLMILMVIVIKVDTDN